MLTLCIFLKWLVAKLYILFLIGITPRLWFVSQCWRKYDYTIIKGEDLGVIFDQFLNFDDHITAICRSTHFHIRNIGKIRNLLSYDACSTIIHALISCRLDYCNSILTMFQKVINIESMCAYDKIATSVLMKLHWLKIQDRIIYKMLMLTYKSYYNMAPPYLCELINKKESHVNTRLGTDHHQLIMPPISKDCSNTFLERIHLCCSMLENWVSISGHQILIVSGRVLKQCYLHMDINVYIIGCELLIFILSTELVPLCNWILDNLCSTINFPNQYIYESGYLS